VYLCKSQKVIHNQTGFIFGRKHDGDIFHSIAFISYEEFFIKTLPLQNLLAASLQKNQTNMCAKKFKTCILDHFQRSWIFSH